MLNLGFNVSRIEELLGIFLEESYIPGIVWELLSMPKVVYN